MTYPGFEPGPLATREKLPLLLLLGKGASSFIQREKVRDRKGGKSQHSTTSEGASLLDSGAWATKEPCLTLDLNQDPWQRERLPY